MIKPDALTIPVTMLGYDFDIIINSWENGFDGYRQYHDNRLEVMEGNLGVNLDLLYTYSQGSEWLAQIPSYYISLSATYGEYQYQILWLVAHSYAAKQLLQQRCLLLVLICDHYKTDNEQALKVVNMGQREILSHLGLDNSKAALNFLDKIQFSPNLGQAIYLLRKYLAPGDKHYLRFKHYQCVNDFCIFLDEKISELTGTKLGIALSSESLKNTWSTISYIRDTIALGHQLAIIGSDRIVSDLNDYDHLVRLHDNWTQQRIKLQDCRPSNADEGYHVYWADAPELGIYAIKNYDALLEESAQQQHCIVAYHDRIASQHYMAFSMHNPERLTIGINCLPDGKGMVIDQIRGKKNSAPSEIALQIIQQWFHRQKTSNAFDVLMI
ncbi:PcfJ domain-containing protein [Photobacterium phosphoreum]|uniref:PcfJ domain-containing protein n=2 Tax=Photobacterium phosphoreum TaxID=659 RepID=UPI001E465F1E|nr:PcfJ domain-containing protein [Photobacterium phosphoreum]